VVCGGVVANAIGEGGGEGSGEQQAGRVDSDKELTIRGGPSSRTTTSPLPKEGHGEGGGMCNGSSGGGGR
jgi:hypothetical protein